MDQAVIPLGKPQPERADAARNRRHLLATAREMVAELGVDKVTMDRLAERACLGKGTVFRRFGTRAGIFRALLDDDETAFQQSVLSGLPPLGPGAEPVERLIAYGRARICFLYEHHALARAALDGNEPIPVGARNATQLHIRMLLGCAAHGAGEARLRGADLDTLAVQLTAALEAPMLLFLTAPRQRETPELIKRMADGWQDLVERVCG
ncbi:TetR/AcrR family transcriptional regulator [Nonomuraea soli]|uniref:AcrR family transcriptional regulator n=1 Tax=Nonomuraea soli TaxID=1032476 RepID=A0A7W0CSW1_9ACTN|nr:TetR/AcrR family transcriptional regulator [Nonomuraea soli]MBA2896555.1 AcrR family transcriptional regulator [Nonomuraea soli]